MTDEVKERLRSRKRDDESFNALLDRLSRAEKDVAAIAEPVPPVDLLNLATGHTEGATFITHNTHDVEKEPVQEGVDGDVVPTE